MEVQTMESPNCLMYNNKIDEIIYKCEKVVPAAHNSYKICKWNGSLGDYAKHVNKIHAGSYFSLMPNSLTFTWTLLLNNNQIDIGILEHSIGLFWYKICYHYQIQELDFSLTCIHKLKDAKDVRYSLQFFKYGQSETVYGVNGNPNKNKDEYITIDRRILSTFTNYNHEINFKISIWDQEFEN